MVGKMKVKKVRKKLHKTIKQYGLKHEKCIQEGRKIDRLAITQMKKSRDIAKENQIEQSLEALLLVTIQLEKFPTVAIWNQFARKNNKLSSISLEYITGKTWNQLRTKINKEIKQMFKRK